MAGHVSTSRLLKALAFVVCATTVSASDFVGGDPRIQSRLYDHLDAANRAYLYGHPEEATAYAEMVLLRRAIKISVDNSGVAYSQRDTANRALKDATINWEDSLDRQVRFIFVPRQEADIVISYAGEMRYRGEDAAGTVRWTRQVTNLAPSKYEYAVRATIVLRTHTPRGSEMNYRQMLHTAGHELGHVLGLEDSCRQGDLMGPLRLDRPVERATEDERTSLIALRTQADLILKHVSGTVVPEPSPSVTPDQEVLSTEAGSFALRQDFDRVDRGRDRASSLRRVVRDKKAKARTTSFRIGGMAD